jgi:hypothetical protein
MIQAHCATAADADQLWRMLCHVPSAEFRPVAVVMNGRVIYRIVRDQGDQQTTVQPEDQLG